MIFQYCYVLKERRFNLRKYWRIANCRQIVQLSNWSFSAIVKSDINKKLMSLLGDASIRVYDLLFYCSSGQPQSNTKLMFLLFT